MSSSAAFGEPGIYKNNGITKTTNNDNNIDSRFPSIKLRTSLGNDKDNIVSDRDLLLLVKQTLDRKNHRDWYYAVTDYGWMLKKQGFSNTLSKQYQKQKKFEGSVRQTRGEILRALLVTSKTKQELERIVSTSAYLSQALLDLNKEQLIKRIKTKYSIYQ